MMDLKQKITSLRKENQSLTRAFLWLCSGTADWDTLVQQLPEHVSQQLPPRGPPLLTPIQSHSCLPGNPHRPTTSSTSSVADRPCTPAPARPRTCQIASNEAYLQPAAASSPLPCTAPGSRSGSTVQPARIDDAWPPGMPSTAVRNTLLQFPALAALESEFQALVSRPATAAEECVSVGALIVCCDWSPVLCPSCDMHHVQGAVAG